MRNIASDAGVAYGLISRYYESKENLLIKAYRHALMKVYPAESETTSVFNILTDLIVRTKRMQKEQADYFSFFKTIMNASDLPEAFIEDRKELFYGSQNCHLYYEAQAKGALPAGDVFGLFQMFLVTLYNLLDMNARYGLPEPSDKVFLDAIHYINPEEQRARELHKKLTKAIGDTFAVLSIIDITDNTASQIYTGNAVVTLSDSTNIRESLSAAIRKYISEADQQMIQDFLDSDTISERISGKKILTKYCMGSYGKLLHTIIPLEYDETGRLRKILAGIQIAEHREDPSEGREEHEKI